MPSPLRRFARRAVLSFSLRNRHRKAVLVRAFTAEQDVRNVILVGCSPGGNPNELVVENAIAERAEILWACDVLPCADVPWPFRIADGRNLPFDDNHTDMVLANAVIEHVGGLADQATFIAEQTRVAHCWVITTPNRWFPVESHTSVLFRHWSRRWRTSRSEFTRLLSFSEFRELLPPGTVVHGNRLSATFTACYAGPPPPAA